MELETISNIGYYASFYVDTTRDQVIKQMKLYITNKITTRVMVISSPLLHQTP